MILRGIAFFAILCTSQNVLADAIDLRPYFPAVTQTHRMWNGSEHDTYQFFYAQQVPSDPFWNLYTWQFDLHESGGKLLIWRKIYGGCTATYGHLYVGGGSDKRIVEVGDWLNNDGKITPVCPNNFSSLGYQYTSVFSSPATGLNWSGPNGLDTSYSAFQSGQVFRGYNWSGNGEYSSPALVQTLSSWSPPYGKNSSGVWVANSGDVYNNVVRIVMFHGVSGNSGPCTGIDPNNPYANYYVHNAGYNTYAMEFYLSPTYGILQETLLYDEGGYFTNGATCSKSFPTLSSNANLTNALHSWQWYLDR